MTRSEIARLNNIDKNGVKRKIADISMMQDKLYSHEWVIQGISKNANPPILVLKMGLKISFRLYINFT